MGPRHFKEVVDEGAVGSGIRRVGGCVRSLRPVLTVGGKWRGEK
jgi:hypothetical protein